MKRLLSIVLCILLSLPQSEAAVSATAVWQGDAAATGSMVNGGGFNPANANFITDYAATSATGDSAVVTSATYTFVAGDDEAWLYVQAGTNWRSGCWFQIDSVAGGAATLNSGAGEGVCKVDRIWSANAVGVATVASPTGGTIGIDYSQQTAAEVSFTDGVIAGTTTDMTSVLTPITESWTGNLIRINSGATCTVGWYEVVNVVTTTATMDRSLGTAAAACTGRMAGALSFNSTLDADWFAQLVAGNWAWMKNGSFTIGETVTLSNDGTDAAPIEFIGFNSLRGDITSTANRPTFDFGTFQYTGQGDYFNYTNLIVTGTAATVLVGGQNSHFTNFKITNSSGTAGRTALAVGIRTLILNSELISTNGIALSIGTSTGGLISGSYLHNSVNCLTTSSGDLWTINFSVFDTCSTSAITLGSTSNEHKISQNTFYGAETPAGTAILAGATAAISVIIRGNIFYGFTTALNWNALLTSTLSNLNDFFNNTTNRTNVLPGLNDLAVDPQFVDGPNANFAIGTNLKATSFPGVIPGSGSTGYLDTGAVQRVEPAGSGGGSFTFVGP